MSASRKRKDMIAREALPIAKREKTGTKSNGSTTSRNRRSSSRSRSRERAAPNNSDQEEGEASDSEDNDGRSNGDRASSAQHRLGQTQQARQQPKQQPMAQSPPDSPQSSPHGGWGSDSDSDGWGSKKKKKKKKKKEKKKRSGWRSGSSEDEGEGKEPIQGPALPSAQSASAASSEASSSSSSSSSESASSSSPAKPKKPTYNPALMGCRGVFSAYERLNTIGQGTYGVVHRARCNDTGRMVALKKIKMEKQTRGFPITSLREINVLLCLNHPNIVRLHEIVVGKANDSIYMVMEYMDHDVKVLMRTMKEPFRLDEVKCLMLQLLRATACMHSNWILHRDLKTSNLLMNNKGVLKVCDMGLARRYGEPIGNYTALVVTLWYRAPELLLGAKTYGAEIDMFSVGCIMAEFLSKEPLLPGKGEFDQLDKIFRMLGTPTDDEWPGWRDLPHSKTFKWNPRPAGQLRKKFPNKSFTGGGIWLDDIGFDLLSKLLKYDPKQRITAAQALDHDWFKKAPLPRAEEDMPKFASSSELSEAERQQRFKQARKHASPVFTFAPKSSP